MPPPLAVPIIVVPGNPASTLLDLYPVDPETVYALTRGFLNIPRIEKHYDRLPLHPDDLLRSLNATGRVVIPARIRAVNIFLEPYENLVNVLRQEVGELASPAPVFPFAYDWRLDTAITAPDLKGMIDEVLAITSLLPAYRAAPPVEVDLVGHSFGGLIIARYLAWCQAQRPKVPPRVRKVVTIASPFRGAVEAMWALIGDLDARHAARTLPAVYEMLPYFERAAEDTSPAPPAPPLPVDLIGTRALWDKSSVEDDLVVYCRTMVATATGSAFLSALLAAADAQRQALLGLDVGAALGSEDNWLPIASYGSDARVRVEVTQPPPDALFAFVTSNDQADDSGDGTVPFLGAIPPFLRRAAGPPNQAAQLAAARRRLVCIKEGDIELQERGSWIGLGEWLGKASLHDFLPRMDAVQRIIIRFLRGASNRAQPVAHPAPTLTPADVDWPPNWGVKPIP